MITGRPKIMCEPLHEFDDWKCLMSKYFTEIKGISKYQCFKIENGELLAREGFEGNYTKIQTFKLDGFPKTFEEFVNDLKPCGFDMLKDEIIKQIPKFKQHIGSCSTCCTFWDEIAKEHKSMSQILNDQEKCVITESNTLGVDSDGDYDIGKLLNFERFTGQQLTIIILHFLKKKNQIIIPKNSLLMKTILQQKRKEKSKPRRLLRKIPSLKRPLLQVFQYLFHFSRAVQFF